MNWITIWFLVAFFVLSMLLAYNLGCIKGMKEIMDIDREFDDKYKHMVIDFICEHYISKED